MACPPAAPGTASPPAPGAACNLPLESALPSAENPAVKWKKVSLVGVGLLGGSLGLALRSRGLAGRVVGYVRRPASLAEAVRVGAVDAATLDLVEAVAEAELVVLCTPIGQMRALAEKLLPALSPGALLTDVGSVKATVVRDLEPLGKKAGVHFVGSHPMAGSERTGVGAARADLFADSVTVVTPTRRTDARALRAIQNLWVSVGSRVLGLSPAEHDELVSRSSHLPYLTAATLARLVLDPRRPKHQATLCANGFRDTTRVASGSPEMWRDIALANRRPLAKALGELIRDLQRVRRLVRDGNARRIETFLQEAKARRDHWQDRRG